jgi:hypothetical protein
MSKYRLHEVIGNYPDGNYGAEHIGSEILLDEPCEDPSTYCVQWSEDGETVDLYADVAGDIRVGSRVVATWIPEDSTVDDATTGAPVHVVDNIRPNVFVETTGFNRLEGVTPEVQDAWEKAVIEHTIKTLDDMGYNVYSGSNEDFNLYDRGQRVKWDQEGQEIANTVLNDAICGGVSVPGLCGHETCSFEICAQTPEAKARLTQLLREQN